MVTDEMLDPEIRLRHAPPVPHQSRGDDWRGDFLERLADEARWELGLVDEIDILDRALDLARTNPNPTADINTPEEAFFFWLGWRIPYLQAGGPQVGRLVLALRGLGVRNVRTLSGLVVRLGAVFRGVIGRNIILNTHVAKRFLERCAKVGGELEGITFSHLRNTIRFGQYFRDAQTGNLIAVHGRTAIAMTVRDGGGSVVIRTIERSTQFTGRNIPARFSQVANPFH